MTTGNSSSLDETTLIIDRALLANLIKSNLSCHVNKPVTQELIEEMTLQIVDSVQYFLNKEEKFVRSNVNESGLEVSYLGS